MNAIRRINVAIQRTIIGHNIIYLSSYCIQTGAIRQRKKIAKLKSAPPPLLRQNEIQIDNLPNAEIINEKHFMWQDMINKLSETHSKDNYKNISNLREVWNNINSFISTQIESSMQSYRRELNFSEISNIINNILTINITVNILQLCSKYDDIELLLTIHEFLIYHNIQLNNDAIIIILSYLNKYNDKYQQEIINIFNNYISKFNKNPRTNNNISKRNKLRMNRKRKRMESNDNINIDIDMEQPDLSVLNCVLDCFSHLNDLSYSKMTMEMMTNEFNISPDIISYNGLIKSCSNISDGMEIDRKST
eukprot:49140_1